MDGAQDERLGIAGTPVRHLAPPGRMFGPTGVFCREACHRCRTTFAKQTWVARGNIRAEPDVALIADLSRVACMRVSLGH